MKQDINRASTANNVINLCQQRRIRLHANHRGGYNIEQVNPKFMVDLNKLNLQPEPPTAA